VDIVSIPETRQMVERFGERYLRRCFGPEELAYCLAQRDPAPHLAARLAAKEAFIKALGGRGPTTLRHIQTRRDAAGAPHIQLEGPIAEHCRRRKVRRFAVSLSHEADYAIAQVIGVL
jgi:holo-[acyl-carrier protein] synthase